MHEASAFYFIFSNLKDGSYHFATIAQNPEKMGYEAVKAVSERDVNTGITTMDAKNFKG